MNKFDTWIELESTKAALSRNGADFNMHNPFLGLCTMPAMKIAFDAGKAEGKKKMRKSNTLGGIIDRLEYYEAELNVEIKRLKDTKSFTTFTTFTFNSASNILDRRNTAMKSLKRLLF